ncbi:MAG: ExbD/TolR family protein [Desulfomonilia bacterium]
MALGISSRRTRKFSPPRLQITSMMDMFTIILIFLLFSFSDDIVTMKIDGTIQLPKSTAQVDYQDSIRIVLSEDTLWLSDEVIASVEDGIVVGLDARNPQESLLYRKLTDYRGREDRVRPEDVDHTHILFLCDKRLAFSTINAIIKTASMAGFPNFQFGVLKQ